MPSLSNNLMRQNTMQDFLHAMHIPTQGINISSIEGLFCFNSKDKAQANSFTVELQKAIQGNEQQENIKEFSLATILADEIAQAESSNEFDRQSCLAILEILKKSGSNILFSPDSGTLEIKLPSLAYLPLFQQLKYPNLKWSKEGSATLDMKPRLTQCSEKIIRFENINPDDAPIIVLNSSALENKIFYAIDSLDDGDSQVQPFFFVPGSTTPPNYHFVLDTSGSMELSLGELKKSVIKLAEQLFDFQPSASIRIITFSNQIRELGTFNRSSLYQYNGLIFSINKIIAEGGTPLYETTGELLAQVRKTNAHNNILLFTDGQDTGEPKHANDVRNRLPSKNGEDNLKAKNKFTVICYNTAVDAIMAQVTQAFSGETIKTNDPDFMNALTDPQQMKNWASARSLFKSTLTVTSVDKETNQETYQVAIDHCGQLAKLNSKRCKPGETLDIFIEDGDGKQILKSNLVLDMPVVTAQEVAKKHGDLQQTPVADALNSHGFLAAPREEDQTAATEHQPAL